jgi:hypothetical protein
VVITAKVAPFVSRITGKNIGHGVTLARRSIRARNGVILEPAMCKLDNIANILERLSGDPLYHASLGSKELFHTNLLAWLCDAYPQEMQKVLPIPTAKPGAKGCAPAREEHDLDLVVRFAGRAPLVIENKVKSLPNHAQLRAYDKVLNRDKELRGAKRVLLSLAEPSSAADGHTCPMHS